MTELVDGTYESLVVDVSAHPDGGARVELALLSGPEKGAVVAIHAPHIDPENLSILGAGASIAVVDGAPTVTFERY